MQGSRELSIRKPFRITENGSHLFSRALLRTRYFQPSSLTLLPFLMPGLYLAWGGSADLGLVLTMLCLFLCLHLTMLEFAGLAIFCNLAFAARGWWFSEAVTGLGVTDALVMFNVLLFTGRYVLFHRLMTLSESNRQLAEMAMVDGLTGAWNRYYLYESGRRVYQRYVRHGTPFCVLLLDIDHFKAINDSRGHGEGDATLRCLADLLADTLRVPDIAGRCGGDEFMIILPDTRLAEGRQTAERVHMAISEADSGTPQQELRASMGLAQVRLADNNFDDVVRHADEALYQSKREGRNTIRIWEQEIRESIAAFVL